MILYHQNIDLEIVYKCKNSNNGWEKRYLIYIVIFLPYDIHKKEVITYLFAFLHSKQQITTKTNKNKHAEDIDQKAT